LPVEIDYFAGYPGTGLHPSVNNCHSQNFELSGADGKCRHQDVIDIFRDVCVQNDFDRFRRRIERLRCGNKPDKVRGNRKG
jgi:hypothetical protein